MWKANTYFSTFTLWTTWMLVNVPYKSIEWDGQILDWSQNYEPQKKGLNTKVHQSVNISKLKMVIIPCSKVFQDAWKKWVNSKQILLQQTKHISHPVKNYVLPSHHSTKSSLQDLHPTEPKNTPLKKLETSTSRQFVWIQNISFPGV